MFSDFWLQYFFYIQDLDFSPWACEGIRFTWLSNTSTEKSSQRTKRQGWAEPSGEHCWPAITTHAENGTDLWLYISHDFGIQFRAREFHFESPHVCWRLLPCCNPCSLKLTGHRAQNSLLCIINKHWSNVLYIRAFKGYMRL